MLKCHYKLIHIHTQKRKHKESLNSFKCFDVLNRPTEHGTLLGVRWWAGFIQVRRGKKRTSASAHRPERRLYLCQGDDVTAAWKPQQLSVPPSQLAELLLQLLLQLPGLSEGAPLLGLDQLLQLTAPVLHGRDQLGERLGAACLGGLGAALSGQTRLLLKCGYIHKSYAGFPSGGINQTCGYSLRKLKWHSFDGLLIFRQQILHGPSVMFWVCFNKWATVAIL